MTNNYLTDAILVGAACALDSELNHINKTRGENHPLVALYAVSGAAIAELQERRKADSEAQSTLKRLAVIMHGSEVDMDLLTVTAQSLVDKCKERRK